MPPSKGKEGQRPQLTVRALHAPDGHIEILVGGEAWEETHRAELQVFDIHGQVLHRTEIRSTTTVAVYKWTDSNLAPGIYFVRCKVLSKDATTSFAFRP